MNSQNVPEGGCSFHRVLMSFILQLGLDALWPRVPFIGRILLWVLWQHISLTAFLVKCRGLVCATVAAEDKGEAFKIKLYFWEGINSLICLSNSPRDFFSVPAVLLLNMFVESRATAIQQTLSLTKASILHT